MTYIQGQHQSYKRLNAKASHLLGVVDALSWEGLGLEDVLDLLAHRVWDLLVVGRVQEQNLKKASPVTAHSELAHRAFRCDEAGPQFPFLFLFCLLFNRQFKRSGGIA